MMSTRISARSSSFIATDDQFRRLSATSGKIASAELRSAVVQPQGIQKLTTAALPDWYGTLPGVMAGKRPAPAPSSVWCCGSLPGAMAGKRPAASHSVPPGSALLDGRDV